MSTATPATQALTRAKAQFRVIEYDYAPSAEKIGLHAAETIGARPETVFKTLMIEVDGKPACAVLPSDQSLSMKKAASAFRGKSAQMMDPAKAERLTGYHTGGISPLGQKRAFPTVIDASCRDHDLMILNGGKRGMMIELAPETAIAVTGASVLAICADS